MFFTLNDGIAERPPGGGGLLPATAQTYVSKSRQRVGLSSATINGWRDGQKRSAATVAWAMSAIWMSET